MPRVTDGERDILRELEADAASLADEIEMPGDVFTDEDLDEFWAEYEAAQEAADATRRGRLP